jgi:cytochrome P450
VRRCHRRRGTHSLPAAAVSRITFLFAGHETTALTLCYALCFVANDTEVTERVRQEARTVLGEESPSWKHLQQLEYTGRVIRETLRLRPPSWAIFREAKVKAPLGDQRIREGDFVLLPQWALQFERDNMNARR